MDSIVPNITECNIPSPFVIVLTLWSLLLGPGAVPTDTTLSNRTEVGVSVLAVKQPWYDGLGFGQPSIWMGGDESGLDFLSTKGASGL
ncbi:hypothetical protein Tco_0445312 [Tanacetum coccineum]